MASYNILFFFILVSFLSFATTDAEEAPIYLNRSCSSNSTIADSALRILLSSLSSNATGDNQFYNTTVTGRDPSDSVYGLFMCRGDVPSQLCQKCVVNGTQRLSSECSLSNQAVIWYDECIVRYSNRFFFSTVATTPVLTMWNTFKVLNPEKFMRLLSSAMNETADKAASPPIGDKKFATKEINISEFQTLYCLAQCTPDLSPHGCRTCLSGAIGFFRSSWNGTQGGRVVYPSCNIRYEVYPFYRFIGRPSPTPAPPPVDDASRPRSPPPSEQRKRKSRTIILIVIPTFVLVMLLFGGYYLLKRKVRKSFKTILTEHFGQESATLEPLQFDLAVIEAATNNFSDENYIGKGGFGEVYKILEGRSY